MAVIDRGSGLSVPWYPGILSLPPTERLWFRFNVDRLLLVPRNTRKLSVGISKAPIGHRHADLMYRQTRREECQLRINSSACRINATSYRSPTEKAIHCVNLMTLMRNQSGDGGGPSFGGNEPSPASAKDEDLHVSRFMDSSLLRLFGRLSSERRSGYLHRFSDTPYSPNGELAANHSNVRAWMPPA